MTTSGLSYQDLEALNQIATTLNQSVDTRSALDHTLVRLLEIMGLDTGWIFLKESDLNNPDNPPRFKLAASNNLPPALDIEESEAWQSGCACQDLLLQGDFNEAYTEVECSRLANASGDRLRLKIHASTPLRSGDNLLGILNVAAESWETFSPEKLTLLTMVGGQLGIALERAQLYEQVKHRLGSEQSLLLSLSNQLLGRRKLTDVINFLVREIPKALNVEACALLLPTPDGKSLCFKAVVGWKSNPITENRLIPLDNSSGPGRVMESQKPLIIEDLDTYDPTTWAPDWIQNEGFRGHAIFPLIVEGVSIGVLILDSRRAHPREEDEITFLELMANQGAIALEKARLQEEEIQRRSLEHELGLGRQIQIALLPEKLPEINGWQFAATNLAALQVGGDFYDCFQLPGPDLRYGFVMADVSGKGVPAALYMAMCRTIVRSVGLSERLPHHALQKANEIIHKDSRADLFLSIFFAHLNPDDGTLCFANGGHNPPLLLRHKSEDIEELSTKGIVLGAIEDVDIELGSVELRPGDQVLFYTDGVSDAINPSGERYGLKHFEQSFLRHQQYSPSQVLSEILVEIDRYAESQPQADDLTLLLIRRNV